MSKNVILMNYLKTYSKSKLAYIAQTHEKRLCGSKNSSGVLR